jgi:hypothetical protein
VRFLTDFTKPVPVMLDLADQKDRFRFARGAPFTVAVWARLSGESAAILLGPELDLSARSRSPGDVFSAYILVSGERPVAISAPRPPGGRWGHVAVTRAPDGAVTLYVDGVPAPRPADAKVMGEVVPSKFGLVYPGHRCDLGDFCVYDRALSADEVKLLVRRR